MKLIEVVRDALRTRHYAYRTEKTYVHWQIGAVEIMWHRLPSRRPTKRTPDAALPPKCQRCIAGDQPLSDCCLAPETPRR